MKRISQYFLIVMLLFIAPLTSSWGNSDQYEMSPSQTHELFQSLGEKHKWQDMYEMILPEARAEFDSQLKAILLAFTSKENEKERISKMDGNFSDDILFKISSPVNGTEVSQRPLVKGSVSNPNDTVWVIVHPMEVSNYWVQPPVSVRSNGSWKVKIHIGRPGIIDIGKIFEIRAFANPSINLWEGMVLNNWPKAEWISDIIEVTRK